MNIARSTQKDESWDADEGEEKRVEFGVKWGFLRNFLLLVIVELLPLLKYRILQLILKFVVFFCKIFVF